MKRKSADVNRVFQALGDPTRRAIMEKLSEGPITVSKLADPMKMTLAAVVQHLQVLEDSGLIVTENIGRVRTCRIEPTGLDIAQAWIAARRNAWETRFDLLGDLLTGPEKTR